MLTSEQIEDLAVFITDMYWYHAASPVRAAVAQDLKEGITAWQDTYGEHTPEKIQHLKGGKDEIS